MAPLRVRRRLPALVLAGLLLAATGLVAGCRRGPDRQVIDELRQADVVVIEQRGVGMAMAIYDLRDRSDVQLVVTILAAGKQAAVAPATGDAEFRFRFYRYNAERQLVGPLGPDWYLHTGRNIAWAAGGKAYTVSPELAALLRRGGTR